MYNLFKFKKEDILEKDENGEYKNLIYSVFYEPQWLSGYCVRLIFGWSLDQSTPGAKPTCVCYNSLAAQRLNWFPSSVQPNMLKGLAKFPTISSRLCQEGHPA